MLSTSTTGTADGCVRGDRCEHDTEREHDDPEPSCSQESAALVEHGLLDELVRSHQHRWWDRQPETLGRPYIDDQIKPYGLFHRQVARLSSS